MSRKASPENSRHTEELKKVEAQLAADPNNAFLHGRAAYLHSHLGDARRTMEEAKKAVSLEPENAYFHYLRAHAFRMRRDYVSAGETMLAALRLEPENVAYILALAEIDAAKGRWNDALEGCEEALRIDPENEACQHFRARALSVLGRTKEAVQVAKDALRNDPDSARSHATLASAQLVGGQRQQAEDSYKEALRIDPEDRRAQDGLMDALRARFPLYALTLKSNLWLARLPIRVQSMFGVIAMLVFRGAAQMVREAPEARPYLIPIIVVFEVFIFMRLCGRALANITLLFHPLGSLALGPRRRAATWAQFLCLALSLVAVLISAITPLKLWIGAGIAGGCFLLLALLSLGEEDAVRNRQGTSHRVIYWGIAIIGLVLAVIGLAAGTTSHPTLGIP